MANARRAVLGSVLGALLLVVAAPAARALDPDEPEALRLGRETRERKLSTETVAGRRLHFADGTSYAFHKNGRARFQPANGSGKDGAWSLGRGNTLAIAYDNGDEDQLAFITIDGAPYLRYLYRRDALSATRGTVTVNEAQREIMRIRRISPAP